MFYFFRRSIVPPGSPVPYSGDHTDGPGYRRVQHGVPPVIGISYARAVLLAFVAQQLGTAAPKPGAPSTAGPGNPAIDGEG